MENTSADQDPLIAAMRITRSFALVAGIVSVVAAAVLIRGYALEQQRGLERLVGQTSRNLTQSFANSIWPRFETFFYGAQKYDTATLRDHLRTAQLHQEIEKLTLGTRVLRVTLYDPAGFIVFSTERSQIGIRKRHDPSITKTMRNGYASQFTWRERFDSIRGPVADRFVAGSYVAIWPDVPVELRRYEVPEAILEIHTDATDLFWIGRERLLIAATAVIGAFLAVYLLLLAAVWRTERAIRRQHSRTMELTQSIARAEATNQATTEFLANMSHELRTPLNAVIGFSDVIRSEMAGPVGTPLYREYATDIYESGRHLLDIINEMLDLAKIESGTMVMARDRVEIGAVAENAVRMVRDQAAQAEVALALRLERPLPVMTTDAARVRQILLNLLSNALKFTRAGGRVDLAVAAASDGGTVTMTVSDTGIGVSKENLPLIMTPFGQVANPMVRSQQGTGLGLPLSVRFARALGGSLDIVSAPGAGTTVTVVLPVTAPEPTPGDPSSAVAIGRSRPPADAA